MTTKLIQKHLLKGTQEFEIIDDYVNVRCKAPFKEEEKITVMLAVLNPEPVISKSTLDFNSRVNGEALISLYLGKPNTNKFNAFVSVLKQKALDEFNAFSGLKPATRPPGLSTNNYDEPPEFEDSDQDYIPKDLKNIDIKNIDSSIQMLKTHLKLEDIKPFVSTLEALKDDPKNETLHLQVIQAFNELGANQGAVLTYAPSIITLLSDDPYGNL